MSVAPLLPPTRQTRSSTSLAGPLRDIESRSQGRERTYILEVQVESAPATLAGARGQWHHEPQGGRDASGR